MSTKFRLSLQLSIFFTFAVMVITISFTGSFRLIVKRNTQQDLQQQAQVLTKEHIVPAEGSIFLKLNTQKETLGASLRLHSLSASLYDKKFRSIARYGAFQTSEGLETMENDVLELQAMKTAQESKHAIFYSENNEGSGPFETILIPLFDKNEFVGIFQVGKDIGIVNQLLYSNFLLALLFIPCGALIGSVLAYISVTGAFLPLRNMLTVMQRIETHNLKDRLDTTGTKDDEIVQLSASFNAMLDRLSDGMRLQKGFVENASHELKTPLTQVISSLDVIVQRMRDKKYKSALDDMKLVKQDLYNMNELINTLLTHASFQNSVIAPENSVNVLSVWNDVKEHFKPLIAQKRARVSTSFSVKHISMTPQELYIIFSNLFSNALKYSPSPATISIQFRKKGTVGELSVADHGKGIAHDALTHIFEKFYRERKSRSESGFGLGLSIVKEICDRHQLTVDVQQPKHGGTCIVISGFILDK